MEITHKQLQGIGYTTTEITKWCADGLEACKSGTKAHPKYEIVGFIEWLAYTELAVRKPTIADVLELVLPKDGTFGAAVEMLLTGSELPSWLDPASFKIASDAARNLAQAREKEQKRRQSAGELVELEKFLNMTSKVSELVNSSMGESFWRFMADQGANYAAVRKHCIEINQRVTQTINVMRRAMPTIDKSEEKVA